MSAPKADVLPITPWEIKKFFVQISVMKFQYNSSVAIATTFSPGDYPTN
jgi:hypothetical protein